MKRWFISLMILFMIILTGCVRKTEDDQHPDLNKDWFRMGNVLSVEPPADFVYNESNDVLSAAGLYYATWTNGDGRNIINPQGREAVVYNAQIYLLVKENESEEDSKADVADWIKRESASYETDTEKTVTVNGQNFTVLSLLSARSENPYDHGMASFAVRGRDAVSVEILCDKNYDGDAEAIMMSFLNGIHY